MPTYLRKNAWDANNGGQFTDQNGNPTDLYWYAKGVQMMQLRTISDPSSWWFYAAIHGEYLLNPITIPRYKYLNWVNIPYIPASANLSSPPPTSMTDLFWDQCQHGTWYFPPWHRGYLVALENMLRGIIISMNGPVDWALPYWNYLNQSTQYQEDYIPPAFMQPQLPDGTTNPLYVAQRYGPDNNGQVYVVVGKDVENTANDECQWDTIYSEGDQPSQPGPGDLFGYFYGGGETGFAHNDSLTGDLEMNPHNFVHGMIGGQNSASQSGLMGVPNTAALDPVFYLHHANIDRMWSAWVVTGNNSNPTDPNWLKGPWANGNSQFVMPLDEFGTPWYYTPADVDSTESVNYASGVYSYTYDDLSLASYITTNPGTQTVEERLSKFGLTELENLPSMPGKRKMELVGASDESIKLTGNEADAAVRLDSAAWSDVSASLLEASPTHMPDEVILQLEGVKGKVDSNFLSVYVNNKFVKSVSLFGLFEASRENTQHGGAGLTFRINITNVVDQLHQQESAVNLDELNVQVTTKNKVDDEDAITIGRIGIYRVGK